MNSRLVKVLTLTQLLIPESDLALPAYRPSSPGMVNVFSDPDASQFYVVAFDGSVTQLSGFASSPAALPYSVGQGISYNDGGNDLNAVLAANLNAMKGHALAVNPSATFMVVQTLLDLQLSVVSGLLDYQVSLTGGSINNSAAVQFTRRSQNTMNIPSVTYNASNGLQLISPAYVVPLSQPTITADGWSSNASLNGASAIASLFIEALYVQ